MELKAKKETAATLVEYALVAALLAFTVLTIAAAIEPGAAGFHEQMGGGLANPYPENFITSTPTPSP